METKEKRPEHGSLKKRKKPFTESTGEPRNQNDRLQCDSPYTRLRIPMVDANEPLENGETTAEKPGGQCINK